MNLTLCKMDPLNQSGVFGVCIFEWWTLDTVSLTSVLLEGV